MEGKGKPKQPKQSVLPKSFDPGRIAVKLRPPVQFVPLDSDGNPITPAGTSGISGLPGMQKDPASIFSPMPTKKTGDKTAEKTPAKPAGKKTTLPPLFG